MLDAVFLAETIDHANWTTLVALTESCPTARLRAAFAAAVGEVEQEDRHESPWAKTHAQQLVYSSPGRDANKTRHPIERTYRP